jgi:hypothetical protein
MLADDTLRGGVEGLGLAFTSSSLFSRIFIASAEVSELSSELSDGTLSLSLSESSAIVP